MLFTLNLVVAISSSKCEFILKLSKLLRFTSDFETERCWQKKKYIYKIERTHISAVKFSVTITSLEEQISFKLSLSITKLGLYYVLYILSGLILGKMSITSSPFCVLY